MKVQLLSAALLFSTAANAQHNAGVEKPQMSEAVKHILAKQLARDRNTASKTTSAPKRLIATSTVYEGDVVDSNHYYYSNGRGSTHTDINSYYDYYYPGSLLPQHIKSDSSKNWNVYTTGSLRNTSTSKYQYDGNNRVTDVTIMSMYELGYGIAYDAQGRIATYDRIDSFGTGTLAVTAHHYKIYDAQNRVVKDSSTLPNGYPSTVTNYIYDAAGNLILEQNFQNVASTWVESARTENLYDASNRLLKTTRQYRNAGVLQDSGLDTFGYNGTTSNQYTFRESYYWDQTNSRWFGVEKHDFVLNSNNKIASYYSYEWRPSQRWDSTEYSVYAYDANDLILDRKVYEYLGNGSFNTDPYVILTMHYESYFPTSISASPATQKLHLYPNPATNELFIDAANTVEVYITNMAGVRVLSATINSGDNKIDISDLAPGVYIISAKNKTEIQQAIFSKR